MPPEKLSDKEMAEFEFQIHDLIQAYFSIYHDITIPDEKLIPHEPTESKKVKEKLRTKLNDTIENLQKKMRFFMQSIGKDQALPIILKYWDQALKRLEIQLKEENRTDDITLVNLNIEGLLGLN